MKSIAILALTGLAACSTPQPAAVPAPSPSPAPAPAAALSDVRAVRRTLPMTDMIRRAHALGTRDSTGRPGRNYWQTRVDYTIDAKLDVATSMITGRERVVLTNHSDTALSTIALRLDQNIFRPDAIRLAGLRDITEGMVITRMVVNGEAVDVNSPASRGEAFPMGRRPANVTAYFLNSTVARIDLTKEIPAKGSANLEIDWQFRVPNTLSGRGLRMGRMADSVYQVAQWYPRIAVFDDLRGWDLEPYLGPSEFYNNYGRFEVSIDVPAGWLVGATGVLTNPEQVLTPTVRDRLSRVLASDSVQHIVTPEEAGQATPRGGRLVWRFAADSVNDFAWATSDRYAWDATRANIPGKGPVFVHTLFMRSHMPAFARVTATNKHALEFYSQLWMPYAWPQLTDTDGPELGMEYPMFIMSGQGAADHETGHQWWPMMVSVNETWYGFMDEGFNVYMNRLSRAHAQNMAPVLDTLGQSYGRTSGNEGEAPLMWNANYGGPFYRFQAYQKAPLMLSMLGGIVGDTAVWQAMSQYAHAWRMKHPTPWDFAFFMNRALGQNLDWFWYYWLFTTDAVNGRIVDVTTSNGRTAVVVRQDGEMPSPVVLKLDFADGTSQTVTYPVDVWFNGSRTYTATIETGTKTVSKVTFDPRARFPDRNPADNVWTPET